MERLKNIAAPCATLCVFLATTLLPGTAAAVTTYYVDQNHSAASDTNPGTEALPWQTMTKAVNTAAAGDTVLVKAGRYMDPEGAQAVEGGNRAFSPANNGTADQPITFKSYPRHAAVLVAKDISGAAMGIFNRSYIIIDGFKVEGKLNIIHGSTHNVIQNCDIIRGSQWGGDPSLNHGILLYDDTQYNVVRNNKVHDMQYSGNNNPNSSCIMVMVSQHNIIEHNEADAGGEIVHNVFGQKGGQIHFNTWRWNIARNAKAGFFGRGSTDGVYLSTDNTFYENIVLNCVTAFQLNHNCERFKIYNNTVYDCNVFFGAWKDSNKDCELWNNMMICNDSCYRFDPPDGSPFDSLIKYSDWNNMLAPVIASWGYGRLKWSPLSNWQTAWKDTTAFDINSISLNPFFVDISSENFHLTDQSPCKGSGRDGVDIGAYPRGDDGTVIGVIEDEGPDTIPPTARISVTE